MEIGTRDALERGHRERRDDGACTCPRRRRAGGPARARRTSRSAGRRSTLDLFGRGFVLLRRPDGGDDVRRRASDTHASTPPGFADAYGIAPGGASLVRPDGIVAWRSATAPDAAEVAAVLDRVLSR